MTIMMLTFNVQVETKADEFFRLWRRLDVEKEKQTKHQPFGAPPLLPHLPSFPSHSLQYNP